MQTVVGVMLGVAILIIVMSIMSGFRTMWRDKILAFKPHIVVSAVSVRSGRRDIIRDTDSLCERIMSIEGVEATTPSVETRVLMQYEGRTSAPIVIGVDPDESLYSSMIASNTNVGVFDVEDDGRVIGRDLAHELGVLLGDRVLLYSPLNVIEMDEMYLPEELVVRGIFDMGMRDFDAGFVLSSLGVARDLVGIEEGAYSVNVTCRDPLDSKLFAEQAWELRAMLMFDEVRFVEMMSETLSISPSELSDRVKQHLDMDIDEFCSAVRRGLLSQPYEAVLGPRSMLPLDIDVAVDELADAFGLSDESYKKKVEQGVGLSRDVLFPILYSSGNSFDSPIDRSYIVSTWQEIDRVIFSALTHEKNMMFILLAAITVVAVFCVTNTLIVITVQKTNEIGLLKALGFSSQKIMGAFVWVGWVQCFLGTLLGLGVGYLVLYNLDNIVSVLAYFGTEVFPKSVYGLDGIPREINGGDIFAIVASVMFFSTISAIIPAWRASRMDPVVALRHE